MSHLTPQKRELAAIGASLASNCIPCIKYHIRRGREAGLTDEEIAEAIEVADTVRQVPARKVQEAATAALGHESLRTANTEEKPACGGDSDVAVSSKVADSPCCDSGVGP
jgi:4-carboxymuconolactone decarboxylase